MASLLRLQPMAMTAMRLARQGNQRVLSQMEPVLMQSFGVRKNDIGHTLRPFSTTPPPPTPPPADEKKKEEEEGTVESTRKGILASIVTPQNQFYALMAGGGFAAYLVSKVILGFTSFFTHLNPAVVVKYGFYTGFGTASLLGGVAVVTADNLYIRADPVFKYCLNWVKNDSKVLESLGDGVMAGNLRSYRLDSGKMELKGTTPIWRPPRIQMIFDVKAQGPPYRTGLVTCEAVKEQGFPPTLHTTLLMVDFETGNEGEGGNQEGDQTIFLRGDEEQLSRISRRSGLSLEMLARQVHINKGAAQQK